MRGYSIDAQRDAIREYAEREGYTIVQEYSDEGVSGTKPYHKRPALNQFMQDIQNGMKVDVLLFCKLDRFYRSVKLYYQAVEIMDRHNIPWKAILEDYETETATGRLKVNLMLAIAENEADRTSERIKFVFENKLRKGEVCTGHVPQGYKIVDHHLVIDEERAELVRDLFRLYEFGKSAHAAVLEIHQKYGIDMSTQTALNMLKTRTYTGWHRGNPEFCPPLITEETFRRVQETMKGRGVRNNQSGQTYIFSGLLFCSECGNRLAGCRQISPHNGQLYLYYRCAMPYHHADLCHRKKRVREDVLEAWLVEHLEAELADQQFRLEAKRREEEKARHRNRKSDNGQPDRASILRKLDRLKDLYLNEVIDLDTYKADYAKLTAQLAELDAAEVAVQGENRQPAPDFQRLREQVAGIRGLYDGWNAEERQTFWRGILRKIVIQADNSAQIFFR